MKKIDPIVLKETGFVAIVSLILSVFMQAVFLIVSFATSWDYTYKVLLGNLLGYIAAVGNFFLMGLTVQKALGKEQKDAANLMRLSQMLRMLMLFVVALVAYLLRDYAFNIIAVIIPFIFPRIGVTLRPLASKIKQRRNGKNE